MEVKGGAHVAVLAWTLQLSAENPDFPEATVLDYLPTHDFELVITSVKSGAVKGGRIVYELNAKPRENLAGSA
jgi:hypothetical protein